MASPLGHTQLLGRPFLGANSGRALADCERQLDRQFAGLGTFSVDAASYRHYILVNVEAFLGL